MVDIKKSDWELKLTIGGGEESWKLEKTQDQLPSFTFVEVGARADLQLRWGKFALVPSLKLAYFNSSVEKIKFTSIIPVQCDANDLPDPDTGKSACDPLATTLTSDHSDGEVSGGRVALALEAQYIPFDEYKNLKIHAGLGGQYTNGSGDKGKITPLVKKDEKINSAELFTLENEDITAKDLLLTVGIDAPNLLCFDIICGGLTAGWDWSLAGKGQVTGRQLGSVQDKRKTINAEHTYWLLHGGIILTLPEEPTDTNAAQKAKESAEFDTIKARVESLTAIYSDPNIAKSTKQAVEKPRTASVIIDGYKKDQAHLTLDITGLKRLRDGAADSDLAKKAGDLLTKAEGLQTKMAGAVKAMSAPAAAPVPVPPVAVDTDPDNDGVKGPADECPAVPGVPTAKGCPDRDSDGVGEPRDNCPNVSNPLQGDKDHDGKGDACDRPAPQLPTPRPRREKSDAAGGATPGRDDPTADFGEGSPQ